MNSVLRGEEPERPSCTSVPLDGRLQDSRHKFREQRGMRKLRCYCYSTCSYELQGRS
jgi:hypothetical protein